MHTCPAAQHKCSDFRDGTCTSLGEPLFCLPHVWIVFPLFFRNSIIHLWNYVHTCTWRVFILHMIPEKKSIPFSKQCFEITAPAHKTVMLLRSIAQQCQQCQILNWIFNMCIFNFCSENLDMSWTFSLVFFLCMFSEVVLIILITLLYVLRL